MRCRGNGPADRIFYELNEVPGVTQKLFDNIQILSLEARTRCQKRDGRLLMISSENWRIRQTEHKILIYTMTVRPTVEKK